MSTIIEVKVPDIGDFDAVEVIEILVNPGDTITAEQSLITVESDKASMEIPSSDAGLVKDLVVKIGDKVNEGTVILTLEAQATPATESKSQLAQEPAVGATTAPQSQPQAEQTPAAAEDSQVQAISVPDIGDFDAVEVIEVLVAPGDIIKPEQSLITVESDKASMEIPASIGGKITQIKVKLGDKLSQGDEILLVQASADQAPLPVAASQSDVGASASTAPEPVSVAEQQPEQAQADAAQSDRPQVPAEAPAVQVSERRSPTASFAPADVPLRNLPHASPSVRKFARELGVNLTQITGSGPKNRITADDVRAYVKQALAVGGPSPVGSAAVGEGLNVLGWPKVDFAKFGDIETQPLSRIKKISGANLHRNWVMIPHVTNNDVADITELENLRRQLNEEHKKAGTKVTMLAFLIKAVVVALKQFPEFNASLDGENLVYKRYFHIGFAADTPNGLVVPVIRDADQKGVLELATETAELAALAREGKLAPGQMQGGCFSISSLGGIGGTDFTPIINAPEVAILGVSRSSMQPVWNGKKFRPRLMLPLSLSYDHRVIDGAAAARFNAYLAGLLADFRRVIL